MKKNKVYVSVTNSKKKVSLKERFENYKGKNLSKEFSWDKDVGREKIV